MQFYLLEKFFIFLQNLADKNKMKKTRKSFILVIVSLFFMQNAFCIPKGTIESTSSVDWVSKKFVSNIVMDTKKAQITLPSGKKMASANIKMKMPELIQEPLLFLYADSSKHLADYVINEKLPLPTVQSFIQNGYKTPDVFTSDANKLKTTNTLELNILASNLVKHTYAYTPEEPIENVPSRAYTGIIIDARGMLTVHGEYVKDNTYPCFFPTIWDENMNVIYEKNMVEPSVIKNNGLVSFDYSDDIKRYENRIGNDPLYIKVSEVFGRNRTDPVIKRSDALKILTVKENVELLKQGKVVILLDKDNLIYNVAVPQKDEIYYAKVEEAKRKLLTTVIPDTEIVETAEGPKYIVQLNFYPDSPKLLPGEDKKIQMIAEDLKNIILDEGYTIMVEGHTADVGKPVGQLNLSIDRAQAVVNALVSEGISRNIMTSKGLGGTLPIADNETEEGRKQNRRVEIVARPRATYIQRDW